MRTDDSRTVETRLTGDGLAKAAKILSIIGLVLSALGVLFFVFFVVLGLASA